MRGPRNKSAISHRGVASSLQLGYYLGVQTAWEPDGSQSAMDCKEIVRGMDYRELRQLWTDVRDGLTVSGWPPGKAFEYLVLRAFELEGAEVTWPYEVKPDGTVIEQIDGAVYADGLAFLLEVKDHRGNIGPEAIAKLRSQLLRRPSTVVGVVFSKTGFTEAATLLTRYMMYETVLLWEGAELSFALEKGKMREGLKTKFRHAVEHGIPDYRLDLGELT